MKLTWYFLVSGMPFDGDTLKKASLGGSETAGLCLAREIAKLGHRVHMFANTKGGSWDGVNYHPQERFLSVAKETPSDVVVVQRAPTVFSNRFESKCNILWQHDLAQGRNRTEHAGVMWNVDRVALLSDHMIEQYEKAIGTPKEIVFKTRNGIDLDLFPKPMSRNRKRLIYSARPERGLDNLVTRIMPELLKRDPEITLEIAGYDNPIDHLAPFYDQVFKKAAAVGAKFVGNLTKRQLYRKYASSGVYVYPTPSPAMKGFTEISCISAMECQAAGLPFVSSVKGALPETLAEGAGTLIDGDPWTDEYVEAFCDAVMMYVENRDGIAEDAGKTGRKAAEKMTWADIAGEWVDEALNVIAEKNDDPVRLAKHFIFRSDVIAAKKAVEGIDSIGAQSVRHHIQKICSYLWDDDRLKAHYDESGTGHEGNWEDHTVGPRYMMMREFVRSKKPETVVDFGCAFGYYVIPMSKEIPETRFYGMDLSPKVLEHARNYANRWQADVEFIEGDQSSDLGFETDVLIAAEILEHVEDPADTLGKIERWVKPGGSVFITVPYGPWEELSFIHYPGVSHVWEVSQADIEEMVGHRQDFSLDIVPGMRSEHDNSPLGWLVASYTKDDGEVRPIDMDRKLRIQAPKQSLSVNMIAGPDSEDTLAWCLKSIRFIADEIVIGDCGMSPQAFRIAKDFGARIVEAPSPIETGFETPRNVVLENSRCDWVLWIDTDEKLLNPSLLPKYLRKNHWQGYGIRQHHFSVDAEFKPDMPVRLFRRAPRDGNTIRFFGQIHEHPELELNKGPGPIVVLSDVHIAHIGYLTEDVRQRRFTRNYPMLQKDIEKYPDRLLQKHFICRDNLLMVQWKLKQTGGQVTEEIAKLCEEVVEIYRKHFLGQAHYVNIETHQYYGDALRVLGRGVDVKFDVQAAKDGHGAPINGGSMRFETEEEAIKEVTWRTKNAISPYLDENW